MSWHRTIAVCALAGTWIAGPASAQLFQQERSVVAFHEARVKARVDDAGALRSLTGALIVLAEVTTEPAEYDRAWASLEKAEALEPGNPDTMRVRARLLLSRHRFPQAFAQAERGLELLPNDTDMLGMAGDAAFEMGDWTTAEARYNKLHSISQQLNSWARLGQVAEARGNLDEAGSMYEKAMETGLRKGAGTEAIAWCHAVLGEVHLKKGNPKEARRLYAAGLQKHPDHPLVMEHLAELEKIEGNLEASETIYRKLMERFLNPVNQLRLAEVVAARGDKKAAEALRQKTRSHIEKVVAAGNEGFLRPLAELEFEAGHFPRAAALASRDVALRPTVESRALLAKILAAAAAAGKPVNSIP